jgi:hypothetical protein
LPGQRPGDFHAGPNRSADLVLRHRRPGPRIASAMRNLPGQEPGMGRDRFRDAAVDHRQLEALQLCEGSQWHLQRQQSAHELTGRSTQSAPDAVHSESMVAGEDDNLRRIERRLQGVLDQSQLNRQRLEFAHAAGCVAAALQLAEKRLLQRHIRDRGDDGTLEGHRSSLQARKRR